MTIQGDFQTLTRLRAALVDLHKKDADQAKRVAEITRKMHVASSGATRASNISTLERRMREAEGFSHELSRAQDQRATLARDISRKQEEIARIEGSLAKKQGDAASKRDKQDKALRAKQDARIRELEQTRSTPSNESQASDSEVRAHDVFISHAWEDKEGFVRILAEKCKEAGVDAWYDETSLRWGESLRRAIDNGLAEAYFGIVVLSENFFKKEWTNYELDGLLQKESSGRGAVLPIWYKVTRDEVEAFSPSLANRLALNAATVTIDQIVEELALRVGELRPSTNVERQ